MKTFKQHLLEAKKKWEPKSFPNTPAGAIDALHHNLDKYYHSKPHEYLTMPDPHHDNTWLVSSPKKKMSWIVYNKDERTGSDFEEANHEAAMKRHAEYKENIRRSH